jgi:hypothetical protein
MKHHANGYMDLHKARHLAKGFAQKYGVEYSKTFAPVERFDTIKTSLSIATEHKWIISQMDLNHVFLNGYIDKEVYVE